MVTQFLSTLFQSQGVFFMTCTNSTSQKFLLNIIVLPRESNPQPPALQSSSLLTKLILLQRAALKYFLPKTVLCIFLVYFLTQGNLSEILLIGQLLVWQRNELFPVNCTRLFCALKKSIKSIKQIGFYTFLGS